MRGHKCPGKFLLLMAGNDDDDVEELAADEDDEVESNDISILNSLIGHGSPRSLLLWEKIGTGDVQMLIDNGSTHSFVRPDVIEHMCLPIHTTKAFKEFTLANTKYELKRDESLRMKRISLHRMQALLETKDVYVVYEFHSLPIDAEDLGTSHMAVNSGQPMIDHLLSRCRCCMIDQWCCGLLTLIWSISSRYSGRLRHNFRRSIEQFIKHQTKQQI
nr:hypothetical protein CTI12_AA406450 [Tanacetum cinerariifolium]